MGGLTFLERRLPFIRTFLRGRELLSGHFVGNRIAVVCEVLPIVG